MHCPACGKGKIFSGLLTIADRCSSCGLEFSGHDIGDGPVYFLVIIISVIVTSLALWLEFSFSPPLWLHMLLWPALVFAATILGLRLSKAMLLKKQYQHRESELRKK